MLMFKYINNKYKFLVAGNQTHKKSINFGVIEFSRCLVIYTVVTGLKHNNNIKKFER